jgi:cell division protein FtsB
MRWVTIVLAALCLVVQADLWLGKRSLPEVWSLERTLDEQERRNEAAKARNVRVEAELLDLREGLEMVEEQARRELGMIKPDEVLVQIGPAKR